MSFSFTPKKVILIISVKITYKYILQTKYMLKLLLFKNQCKKQNIV